MSYTKTTGIVLRRTNLGEADRIITFITPSLGKIKAVARGVRRIKSRMAGHLELFGEVSLMLAEGRNLDVITSARLVQSFDGISSSYEPLTYGYLFAEMVDKLTQESHPQPELYQALRECYAELNQNQATALVELFFKLRLLGALGYRPNLEQCAVCQKALSGTEYFLNPEFGGIVDSACNIARSGVISQNQIKLWRLLLVNSLDKVKRLGGTEGLAEQGLAACDSFYDYVFGTRFKSQEVMRS